MSVISAPISIGSSKLICSHMEQLVVSSIGQTPTVTFSAPTGTGNGLLVATLDDFGLYGGTVQNLAITTEGKFYTSPQQ